MELLGPWEALERHKRDFANKYTRRTNSRMESASKTFLLIILLYLSFSWLANSWEIGFHSSSYIWKADIQLDWAWIDLENECTSNWFLLDRLNLKYLRYSVSPCRCLAGHGIVSAVVWSLSICPHYPFQPWRIDRFRRGRIPAVWPLRNHPLTCPENDLFLIQCILVHITTQSNAKSDNKWTNPLAGIAVVGVVVVGRMRFRAAIIAHFWQ